jgi:hypothetical protein
MSDKVVPIQGRFSPGHAKLGGRKKTVTRARDLIGKYTDPLVWMLRLLRDGSYDAVLIDPATGKKTKVPTVAPLELMLDCAKACVGFVHPRLSATQLTGANEGPVQSLTLDMNALLADPELARQAQAVALALTKSNRDTAPGSDVVVYDAAFELSKE